MKALSLCSCSFCAFSYLLIWGSRDVPWRCNCEWCCSISNWTISIFPITSTNTWSLLFENLMTWEKMLLCFCMTLMLPNASVHVRRSKILIIGGVRRSNSISLDNLMNPTLHVNLCKKLMPSLICNFLQCNSLTFFFRLEPFCDE